MPAFRELLVRELTKSNTCGSATWHAPSTIVYTLTNYQNGSFGGVSLGTNAPPDGTTVDLRWCDWTAWSLARGKHIPPFNLFLPIGLRNAALAQARATLRQP